MEATPSIPLRGTQVIVKHHVPFLEESLMHWLNAVGGREASPPLCHRALPGLFADAELAEYFVEEVFFEGFAEYGA
jgi:hypothetical protein